MFEILCYYLGSTPTLLCEVIWSFTVGAELQRRSRYACGVPNDPEPVPEPVRSQTSIVSTTDSATKKCHFKLMQGLCTSLQHLTWLACYVPSIVVGMVADLCSGLRQ